MLYLLVTGERAALLTYHSWWTEVRKQLGKQTSIAKNLAPISSWEEKPQEYNLEAYLNHRGATSSLREDLTYEVSEWVKFFSASDKQVLRDVANSFKLQWKTISDFWDEIAEQESQRQQLQRLMDQRKMDLRKQNVRQFRIDGDAMTGELEKALGGK